MGVLLKEDFQKERNLGCYLEHLINSLKDIMLILVVKDSAAKLSDEYIKQLRAIGFNNISTQHQITYVGIICNNKTVVDISGSKRKEPVVFEESIDGLKICAESHFSKAVIKIGYDEYISTDRGLNFLVYDNRNGEIIDFSCYDAWTNKPQFFHKYTNLSNSGFSSRLYMLDNYRGSFECIFSRRYLSNRTLNVTEIEGGVIEPNKEGKGGVCTSDFKFITGHIKHNKDAFRQINNCYEVNKEEMVYCDETVIYGGSMFNHPGHMIVETFAARVWWLIEHPDNNNKIAITKDWGWKGTEFIVDFFKLININEDRIIIVDKPTKFKKIIIPDSSLILRTATRPYEYTKECKEVFDVIRKKFVKGNNKKIYLTKKDGGRKNLIGEEWFIEFYKSKGYLIIYPEDYSTHEKIQMMIDASEVVAQSGTNILWTVFCNSDTMVTVLTRTKNIGGGGECQSLVFELAGITDYKIVDVSAGFLDADFTYGLSAIYVSDEFKKFVKEVFNCDIDISSEDSLKEVVWDYLHYYPEYMEKGDYFQQSIKNQKMIDVLKRMCELFLHRDFKTTGMDLITLEDEANKKLRDARDSINLLKALIEDLSVNKRLIKKLNYENVNKIAIIADESLIADSISTVLNVMNLEVVVSIIAIKESDISSKQWEKCCNADIILWFNHTNSKLEQRYDVPMISIRQVLNDPLLDEKKLDCNFIESVQGNNLKKEVLMCIQRQLEVEKTYIESKYRCEMDMLKIQRDIFSL